MNGELAAYPLLHAHNICMVFHLYVKADPDVYELHLHTPTENCTAHCIVRRLPSTVPMEITKKGRCKMEILDKMGSIAVMVDDSQVLEEANALNDIADIRASVNLKTRDKEIELLDALSRLVMSVIESVSKGDTVTISTIPEEISAPTAASMLGVSRPTFLKWAKERNLTTKKWDRRNDSYPKMSWNYVETAFANK